MISILARVTRGLLGTSIYVVGVLTLLFFEPSEFERGAITLTLLVLQVLRLVMRGYSDSLTISLSATAILLYAIPGSAIVLLLRLDVLPSVLLFIVFFDVMTAVSLRDPRQNQGPMRASLSNPKTKLLKLLLGGLLFWCALAGFLMDPDGFLSLMLFVAPYSVSLVLFERLLAARASLRIIIFWAIAYLIMLVFYVTFHWSGFGRLVIGGFALAPLLIINHHRDIALRTAALALLAPIVLYFAQLSRYGTIDDAESLLIGSAGHHLIVTNDVLNGEFYRFFGGIDIFISQYVLLFLNWVPRSWSQEKPIGVGFWSVDAVYGRDSLGETYNQSIGFLGELYLYLGPDFWIGGSFILITLLLLRRFIARYSYGFITPLVIFDVNLISYFWGGMATFGSRAWFMIVPALIMAWWFRGKLSARNSYTKPTFTSIKE